MEDKYAKTIAKGKPGEGLLLLLPCQKQGRQIMVLFWAIVKQPDLSVRAGVVYFLKYPYTPGKAQGAWPCHSHFKIFVKSSI